MSFPEVFSRVSIWFTYAGDYLGIIYVKTGFEE